MKDIFILDTNPIIDNPNIIYEFNNALIILPLIVLSELDKFKNELSERGANCRAFSRVIDKLFENNYKVDENNVTIKIMSENEFDETLLTNLGGRDNDNIIIHLADTLKHQHPDSNVVVVSNDILFRAKARGIGLSVHSFTNKKTERLSDNLYNGYLEHYVSDELIDTAYINKFLDINDIEEIKFYPHMFIILKSFYSNKSAILKADRKCRVLELVNTQNMDIYGFGYKNAQQLMLMHLLLDDEIPLVTVCGPPGSGKTFLPLLTGLFLTEDEGTYKRLMLTKANSDLEKDIGALPGGLMEKLDPLMQSYYDNLRKIFKADEDNKDIEDIVFNLKLDVQPLNYFRGRTLEDRMLLLDEAQNLNHHQGKTMITRIGNNGKIIIMGDLEQIDNPRVDYYNNALYDTINAFKEDDLAAHITLPNGKARSPLADRAAKLL